MKRNSERRHDETIKKKFKKKTNIVFNDEQQTRPEETAESGETSSGFYRTEPIENGIVVEQRFVFATIGFYKSLTRTYKTYCTRT